jgi:PAS domain-containing protein
VLEKISLELDVPITVFFESGNVGDELQSLKVNYEKLQSLSFKLSTQNKIQEALIRLIKDRIKNSMARYNHLINSLPEEVTKEKLCAVLEELDEIFFDTQNEIVSSLRISQIPWNLMEKEDFEKSIENLDPPFMFDPDPNIEPVNRAMKEFIGYVEVVGLSASPAQTENSINKMFTQSSQKA